MKYIDIRLRRVLNVASYLPNYVKAFGVVAGLWLLCQIVAASEIRRESLVKLKIPLLGRHIWLRPGRGDISIFHQVLVKQEYSAAGFQQFSAIKSRYSTDVKGEKKPLIIDCGAHIGLSVLWFNHIFPDAMIYAVEPDSENYEVLKRNIEGLPHVIPLQGGIWNRPGILRIANPDAGATAFQLTEIDAPSGALDVVRGYSVGEIFSLAGTDEALILKLDIEGAEAQLFRDKVEWLDKTSLVIVELHDWLFPWSASSQGVLKQVGQRAFDVLFRGENIFCFRHPE